RLGHGGVATPVELGKDRGFASARTSRDDDEVAQTVILLCPVSKRWSAGRRYSEPAIAEGAMKAELGDRIDTIDGYNAAQVQGDRESCEALAAIIGEHLAGAESKIWHAHPVWFLGGNPIVGYSKLKGCVRLLFWSGQSFETPG